MSHDRIDSKEIDPRHMPPGTKVWIYLRHSPGDKQTLDSQESEVLKLVHANQWVDDRTFRDKSVSGRSAENREAFQQMMYYAKKKPRPADLLIIWDYSRLSRNQIHAQLNRAQLRSDGWQILSMNDDIPVGPLAPIFEALIDWKNEQYLNDLRANTRRGQRFVADKGYLPGGKPCKGYRVELVEFGIYRDGRPRFGRKPMGDPAVEALVKRAFELKALSAPHEAISSETGLYPPKSGSWEHFFHNRAYIGEYEFHGEVFTNIYPPMVDRDVFEAVQRQMPRIKTRKLAGRHHPRRLHSSFFLANICECGYCGSPLVGKGTRRYRYYVCSSHSTAAHRCPNARLIPADLIETKVMEILAGQVLQQEYLQSLLEWTNTCLSGGLEELTLRIKTTRKDLKEAERLAYNSALNFGKMESLPASAEKVLRDQDNHLAQLQLLLGQLEYQYENSKIEATPDQISRYLRKAQAMIEHGELFDLREVCEQIFTRIVGKGRDLQIEVHFPEL